MFSNGKIEGDPLVDPYPILAGNDLRQAVAVLLMTLLGIGPPSARKELIEFYTRCVFYKLDHVYQNILNVYQ